MTIEAHIAAAAANKEAARNEVENGGDMSALRGIDFAGYCARQAAKFSAKAASVKSEAARAKWEAIAKVWAAQ